MEIAGARFLDLFAGSGAMGFEAISRGATFATFVENDRIAAQCIRENIEMLEVGQQVQVLAIDVKQALSKLLGHYDLIYIDPPYDKDVPDTLALIVEKKLLAPQGLIFLEERFDSKKSPQCPGLDLIDSRRYGIAHLHQFRLCCTGR
jgi:16S rRNA (guanine(966)-N(2))-methyltransferase RsmD